MLMLDPDDKARKSEDVGTEWSAAEKREREIYNT